MARRVELNVGVDLVADVWSAEESRGTVLLLHGGGQTRHSWRRTGERLAAHGWRTASVDARGHGESAWAADRDYSLDALVADLRAVVARSPEPPVLVGASMGGCTALLAEGEHPGTARALVLVDVVPRIEPDGADRVGSFMRSAQDGFGTLEEVVEAIHAYNPRRDRPLTTDGVRRNVRLDADGRWRWHWDPALLARTDLADTADVHRRMSAAARALTTPTLLVRGADSDIVSSDGVAEFRAMVPHAESVEVSRTGHMVAGDDNDRFAGALLAFLDRLPPLSATAAHRYR